MRKIYIKKDYEDFKGGTTLFDCTWTDAWADEQLGKNNWKEIDLNYPNDGKTYEWDDSRNKWVEDKGELYKIKKQENDKDWQTNDSLFNQWQKAEKLGWSVATKRKKVFDAHTKKVTAEWHGVQKLKKELGEK